MGEENAEYKELKQSDTAAKEILLFAKNRLNKFYNPKLYKPPTDEPAMLVQVAAHKSDEAPAPPPESFGAYTKRADDSKSMSDKTASKASEEEALETEQDTKAATGKGLMATLEYIRSLHGECDWLLKYFDARKEARDGELDALGKAKAVLNGADFSLIQTRSLRGHA